jgi:hypothetical protein
MGIEISDIIQSEDFSCNFKSVQIGYSLKYGKKYFGDFY